MTYGKVNENQYLLRLEKGEEITEVVKHFCKIQNIQNASISALGSIESPTLAHYRVDSKKYSEKALEGIFEVTSLLGTVGMAEGEPVVHLHATISDESMTVFGGHLAKGRVSATLEMVLTVFQTSFEKIPNEEIGLKLFELPDQLES